MTSAAPPPDDASHVSRNSKIYGGLAAHVNVDNQLPRQNRLAGWHVYLIEHDN